MSATTSRRELPLHIARQIRFRQHPTMTACWRVVGRAVDESGRPRLSRNGVVTSARQVVYSYLVGPPPPVLKPRCRKKWCVNPHHMKDRD